jgi:hypothetical protein
VNARVVGRSNVISCHGWELSGLQHCEGTALDADSAANMQNAWLSQRRDYVCGFSLADGTNALKCCSHLCLQAMAPAVCECVHRV